MAKEEDPICKLHTLMIHLREEFDQWLKKEKDDKQFSAEMQFYLDAMFQIADENIVYRKVEKEKI